MLHPGGTRKLPPTLGDSARRATRSCLPSLPALHSVSLRQYQMVPLA